MRGLFVANARPMRPRLPFGSPSLSDRRRHVSPPSQLVQMPLPGPPEVKNQGKRRCSHVDASRCSGFDGSITSSNAPVRSFTYSTLRHVLPPSVVLKTPRSTPSLHAGPCADNQTVFGSRGCTMTSSMRSVPARPRCDQLRPPSTVFHTPRPTPMLLRVFASPVPT